jgi:hypothetical protein
MESELASMEHSSISVSYTATILQDKQVRMLTQDRPVSLETTRPDLHVALHPSLIGDLSIDSRKVIATFCPVGIKEAKAKYHTQYGKHWWNEY